jgi:hypothetical protein
MLTGVALDEMRSLQLIPCTTHHKPGTETENYFPAGMQGPSRPPLIKTIPPFPTSHEAAARGFFLSEGLVRDAMEPQQSKAAALICLA